MFTMIVIEIHVQMKSFNYYYYIFQADHRLSTLGSVLDARLSLQPQVVLYEAIVRMSGNPSLNEKYMGEKSDNQTTQAA